MIDYSSRPFADLDDMTESLVDRWNSAVKPGDIVYHLGDFALSWGNRNADDIDRVLSRLNGQKTLIIGNHDRDEVTKNPRWNTVKHYHEIKIDMGGVHRQRIVMSHYPFRVWNQMHRGAWMVHGHCHGNLTDIGGKTMDVGVDCHDYRPISSDAVSEFMAGRDIVSVDHHQA